MEEDVLVRCVCPGNFDEIFGELAVVGAVDRGEDFTCDAGRHGNQVVARRGPEVELNWSGTDVMRKDVVRCGKADEIGEGLVNLLDEVEAPIVDRVEAEVLKLHARKQRHGRLVGEVTDGQRRFFGGRKDGLAEMAKRV